MRLHEAIKLHDASEILTEGLSPVLFHSVSLDKALWIIKNQMLPSDKMGHISFSRSRTNTFMDNMGDNMEGHDGVIVVLELDGRKLMANAKGRSIDPFAPNGGDFDEDEYSRDSEFDYMEDRIILPKGQANMKIPRMGVSAVHFIVNDGDDTNLAYKTFSLISDPNKYVYKTIRDFQQGKSTDPTALESDFKIMGKEVSSSTDLTYLISDIGSGIYIDPSDQDIANFVKAYNKWKHDFDVKNEMKELVMAYNRNGVKVTKASELLSKSHLL